MLIAPRLNRTAYAALPFTFKADADAAGRKLFFEQLRLVNFGDCAGVKDLLPVCAADDVA